MNCAMDSVQPVSEVGDCYSLGEQYGRCEAYCMLNEIMIQGHN